MENDVILLGNGVIDEDHTDWVDQSVFVVRFNIPRRGGVANGNRCDALCVTNHGIPARRFAKYRELKNHPFVHSNTEIWVPRPLKNSSLSCYFNHPVFRVRWQQDHSSHIIRRNGWQKQMQVFFSEPVWDEAFSILSLDQNQWRVSPSSGFLALVYCLRRFPHRWFNIHLLGFSFEGSAAHPWKLEREAVERMAARREVSWIEAHKVRTQTHSTDKARVTVPLFKTH